MTEKITPLVSVQWLSDHLNDASVRVVDVRWYLTEPGRGWNEYLAAHIPGAVFMDVDTDLAAPRGSGPGRHPLPTIEKFTESAGRAGIGAETHVVVYDSAGGAYATRLWWLLRYLGHEQVSLLDGGWQAWSGAGLPVEADEQQVKAQVFTPHPQAGMVVDAATVEALRHDPSTLLLDARATERYEGQVEPIDPRAGHIPGAKSAPFAGNLDSSGKLLSSEALQARYAQLGADDAQRIICYCGSGVSATHDLFALYLAGQPDALLYEGSWSDWSSDPQRPVATGPEAG